MAHQIDAGIQEKPPPQPELVAGPDQSGETCVSLVVPVIEAYRVATDAGPALEVQTGAGPGIELGYEECAAQRFDSWADWVDPGENLGAQPEMLADGAAQPEGDGRLVEHIAVPDAGLEIERFAPRTQAETQPETAPAGFAHRAGYGYLHQPVRRLLGPGYARLPGEGGDYRQRHRCYPYGTDGGHWLSR